MDTIEFTDDHVSKVKYYYDPDNREFVKEITYHNKGAEYYFLYFSMSLKGWRYAKDIKPSSISKTLRTPVSFTFFIKDFDFFGFDIYENDKNIVPFIIKEFLVHIKDRDLS